MLSLSLALRFAAPASDDAAPGHYEVLGLRHDCTDRDIERVFIRLSRKLHPDKNKGDAAAAARYADVSRAYAVLRDPARRRVYDLWGEAGLRVYEAPRAGGAPGDGDAGAPVRAKARALRVVFPAALADFHRGAAYALAVTRRAMCRCPEAGFACERCRGRPTLQENATLRLAVERGADEGTVVVFEGAGDASEVSAPGDIEVVLVSRRDPVFTRVGADLHIALPITLREALLGFARDVDHIDGSRVVVRATEPVGGGRVIVVKGRGLAKYLCPGEFGDLVVHPTLLWPKALDPEKKARLVRALG
jgi:DnaJ-class molecular chaperone